jgi:hypothetical protein
MKPLFLIGAALMVGAGIYGFIDYKKTSHRREFQSLYKEKKEEPKEEVEDATPAPPEVVQNEIQEGTTPDSVVVEEVPVDVPVYVVKNGKVVAEKKQVAIDKKTAKKKVKRFRPKQFSRAEMEEEIMLEEPAVKEKQ